MLTSFLNLLSPTSILLSGLVWLIATRELAEDSIDKINRIEQEISTLREKSERLNSRLSRMEGKIDLLLSR